MKPAGAALLALGFLCLAFPGLVAAEPYIAAYAGLAMTQDKDLEIVQDLDGAEALKGTLMGVEFDRSVVFGGKAGYFFRGRTLGGNFGFEYELYHFRPNINGQTVEFSGTVLGSPFSGSSSLGEADVSVIAGALNFLYRIPLGRSRRFPRGQLQPYVGLGGGIFLAEFETESSILDSPQKVDDTDVRPGVQGLAGLKLFLTRNVAVFGEYKYIFTTDFEFKLKASGTVGGAPATETTTLRGSLTGHQFNAGLAIHF
jgi:opacity protein-like surface antigen